MSGRIFQNVVLQIKETTDRVIGVLDIDSPMIGRFDETDQEKLMEIVQLLEIGCDFSHTGYTL